MGDAETGVEMCANLTFSPLTYFIDFKYNGIAKLYEGAKVISRKLTWKSFKIEKATKWASVIVI